MSTSELLGPLGLGHNAPANGGITRKSGDRVLAYRAFVAGDQDDPTPPSLWDYKVPEATLRATQALVIESKEWPVNLVVQWSEGGPPDLIFRHLYRVPDDQRDLLMRDLVNIFEVRSPTRGKQIGWEALADKIIELRGKKVAFGTIAERDFVVDHNKRSALAAIPRHGPGKRPTQKRTR